MNEMPCYCGHDCARCLTYLATVRDDQALRERSRVFYREEMKLSLPLEDIRCRGGRACDEEVFSACRDCPFRTCCREHGYESCEQCAQFPCQLLAAYRERYVNRCHQAPKQQKTP